MVKEEDAERHDGAACRLDLGQEVDFANREIDRRLDARRHRFERTAREITGILGFSAALMSAVALLIAGAVEDPRPFYLASIPLLILLSAFGLFFACSMTRGMIHNSMDLMAVDLLRSFVIDHSSTLAAYTPPRRVTIADLQKELQKLADHMLHTTEVLASLAVSSTLNGVAAGVATWWALEPASRWLLIGVGGGVAMVSLPAGLAYVVWVRQSTASDLAKVLGLQLSPATRRLSPGSRSDPT